MSVSDFSIIVQPPLQPDFQLTEILFIFDTIAQVSPLYYVSKLVKSLPTSHLWFLPPQTMKHPLPTETLCESSVIALALACLLDFN